MNRKAGQRPPQVDSGPRREGLGRAIQALRAERGLKRQRLAEDAGLSYAYLAEIENGKKEPSTRVLDAIARALGIRLPELMEVAESLQTMVEETEDELMALEVARAPERGPLMARRLSAPDRTWFHRPAEPAAEGPTKSEGQSFAMRITPGTQSGDMLDELQQLASRLPPEDLERLLEIARRLSR